MEWFAKKLLLISFTILLASFSLNTQASSKEYEVMLIANDFEFCRSSANHLCKSSEITTLVKEDYRRPIQYKLVISQIKKMMNVELWRPSRQAFRYDLQLLFNGIAKKAGIGTLSYSQLINVWKSVAIKRDGKTISGHSLFLSMTKDELAMVLDHLEFEQVDYAGRRLKEKISLVKSDKSSTIKFAKKIIKLAKNDEQTPNVLIVPAGMRDSFVDVDSYVDLFNQLGANASWLPIDAALNKLLSDKKQCDALEKYRADVLNSYDRKRIYGDLIDTQMRYCNDSTLFNKAIADADAIIVIGDNPKLLNDSFMVNNLDNKLLQQIRKKIQVKELMIVAIGNMAKGLVSKGTHGAVILQGDSQSAMTNGTSTSQQIEDVCKNYGSCETDYHSVIYQLGGIGLIDFPIIDTNVSSSGNVARLAKVGLDSKLNMSLSIDRNTALLVRKVNKNNQVKVIGEQGIVLLSQPNNSVDLTNIKYSYFTPEDVINFDQKNITINYPDWKNPPEQSETELAHYKNLFYGDSFKRFSEQACVINHNKWAGNAGRHQQFRISLEKNRKNKLYMGALKVGDDYQFYCSINAMSLRLIRN